MEFFHSEQKGERTQSAPSSLQCAEQLQSHSAKSIQTQSRSAPQKGITSPYRSNYITYKPNKRAQADLSAHRPDSLRLREGKWHRINYDFYIPQDTVYVKRQIFKMWCFIRLRRIFIMRIMYIFRADHRFMISTIRIAAVFHVVRCLGSVSSSRWMCISPRPQ